MGCPSAAESPVMNRFTPAISLLARRSVPEYYLLLAARVSGRRVLELGLRFVSCGQSLRQQIDPEYAVVSATVQTTELSLSV
jgi:hypothetical protein